MKYEKEQDQLVVPHVWSGSAINQVAIPKPEGDIPDVNASS
jgi:hypothetical protein